MGAWRYYDSKREPAPVPPGNPDLQIGSDTSDRAHRMLRNGAATVRERWILGPLSVVRGSELGDEHAVFMIGVDRSAGRVELSADCG